MCHLIILRAVAFVRRIYPTNNAQQYIRSTEGSTEDISPTRQFGVETVTRTVAWVHAEKKKAGKWYRRVVLEAAERFPWTGGT